MIIPPAFAARVVETIKSAHGYGDIALHLALSQTSSAFYRKYEQDAYWGTMCSVLGYAIPAESARLSGDTASCRAVIAAVNRRFPRFWQVNVYNERNRRAPESLCICPLETRPQSSVKAWDGMVFPQHAAAYEVIVGIDARNDPMCTFESYSTYFWQGNSLSRYRLVSCIVVLELDHRALAEHPRQYDMDDATWRKLALRRSFSEQLLRDFGESPATVADAMLWFTQQTQGDPQIDVSMQDSAL